MKEAKPKPEEEKKPFRRSLNNFKEQFADGDQFSHDHFT